MAMAGYDPNRPRPADSGPFIGLPGDPVVDYLEPDSQRTQQAESEVGPVAGGEDETSATLQSVPQTVPPLDRRVPMMAVVGSVCGLALLLLVWRRLWRHQ
ncbi:MAG: hypothetical protein ACJZ57_07900 [Candidatus Poriferisodalaceae bacterium]|nr:MAG: hypothetical protein CNE88_00145 [Acidimicrobiales bacterium MED-G01]